MRPIFPWYIPIQRTLETPFGSFHGPSLPNMTNCHRQFHPVRNETRALTTGSTTGLVLLWQLTGGPETSRSLNVWQRKEKKKKSLLFPFQSQIIEETKGKTKRNLMATFIDLKQCTCLGQDRVELHVFYCLYPHPCGSPPCQLPCSWRHRSQ